MVTLFFGVAVLRALNGEESARLMVYAARRARWFTTGAVPRHGKRPKGKRKARLALLQGLPGVGPLRACASSQVHDRVDVLVQLRGFGE